MQAPDSDAAARQHRRSAKAIVSQLHDKIKAESALISKLRRQEQLQQRRLHGADPTAPGNRPAGASQQLQAEIRQAAREGAMRLLQGSGLASSSAAAPSSPAPDKCSQPSPGPSSQQSQQSQHQQHLAPRQSPGPSPFTPAQGARAWDNWFGEPDGEGDMGGEALTDEEVVRLLEDQLYSSLIAEELEAMDREQQQQVEAMAEDYERWQQQGCGTEERVLCPVCGRAALVQLHGVVACPLERWQLDVRVESLTLDSLKQRLASTYEAHTQSGCCGSLRFMVESSPLLGDTQQLVAGCHTCGMLQIVI